MSVDVYLKVYNENQSQMYRIKTSWKDDSFVLHVIENMNSWFASVSKEDIKELAELHELDPHDYLKNLKEYFSRENDCCLFDIAETKFIMYRKIETENLKVKYFFKKLQEVHYQETIESIIDELITKHEKMLKELQISEEKRLESERQKILYRDKCGEFLEMKCKMETKMYSAFALLLNEKKHRLQLLTELLGQTENYEDSKFNTSLSSQASSNQVNKSNKKYKIDDSMPSTSRITQKKILEKVSDGEYSDGYDTDDERKLRTKLEDKEPSTATTSKTDDLDFLGDSSPPPSLPKRTRRVKDTKEIAALLDSPKKDIKEEVKETKVEQMDIGESNVDTEQSVAFSTQELWDRM